MWSRQESVVAFSVVCVQLMRAGLETRPQHSDVINGWLCVYDAHNLDIGTVGFKRHFLRTVELRLI